MGEGARRRPPPLSASLAKTALRGEGGEFEGNGRGAGEGERAVPPASRAPGLPGVLTCNEGLCATRLGVTVLVVLDAMPDSVRVFRGWLPGSRPLGGWLLLAARVLLAPVGAGEGQGT